MREFLAGYVCGALSMFLALAILSAVAVHHGWGL